MIHPLIAEAVIVAADATPQQYNQDGSPTGSPGFLGFVVTMVVGIGIILLMLDMTRRARRMRYRNEYAMAREAEERARQGSTPVGVEPSTGNAMPDTADSSSQRADDLKASENTTPHRESFH
ncbi:MAG: hypothetical protein Q3974_04325 [Rothia sp. (in: high G+C Gram-positive bacteria)]|nr:hypothetical protein [Rothia sp. (in: high G+C Gram-positive bacteria)]